MHEKKHDLNSTANHNGISGASENNVATFDASGFPKDSGTALSSIVGGMTYQGTWDADTNDPTLVSSTGTKGHYYVVSVAGSTALDGISEWKIGDYVVFNGAIWQKIDNTDQVSSVFTRTGAVTAQSGDYAITQISANNWILPHSNGSGAMVELALGAANAPLLGGGAAAAPVFGSLLFAPAPITCAGVTPVDTEVSAWGNNTIGICVGTGGRIFGAYKNATDVYYMEFSEI